VSWGIPGFVLLRAGVGVHLMGAGWSADFGNGKWDGRGARVPCWFKGEERPGSGKLRVTTARNSGTGALFAMQHNGSDHALKVTATALAWSATPGRSCCRRPLTRRD
jgi:hypothetical protein